MFCRLKHLNKLFLTGFVPGIKDNKVADVDVNTKTGKKMLEELDSENRTGMDRLYMMFTTDEFGEPSPEIVNVGNIMMLSMFFGAATGGFLHSRVAFLNFVERNDATSFTSHLDAKQKLQDKVTIGFARGAYRVAWRLTAFTGIYTVTSTAISVYRGKSGFVEHVVGGLVTGAVYKCNLGVRGIVVGGSLGMFLGLFAGTTFWVISKLTGITVNDAMKFSHMAKKNRDASFQQAVNQYLKDKEPAISDYHDSRPGITDSLQNLETPK